MTWCKHNAAMILATESIKELNESRVLAIVAESCLTKIFFAHPPAIICWRTTTSIHGQFVRSALRVEPF
uniref:Uncharacterized protein n=1 Tax=mine drainage metagenome TaxID=410659 RepID=E6QKH8_9ZZZZ